MPNESLPAEVIAAIRSGNTVAATKLLRESSGLGLKKAKDAVDAYARGVPLHGVSVIDIPNLSAGKLPAEVLDALQQRRKIEAIRLLRERTGMGLKDAKEAVESYQRAHPGQFNGYPSAEVPRSNGIWPIVLTLIAAALAYYVLHDSR
jgi:ribosomal protein L7/L12